MRMNTYWTSVCIAIVVESVMVDADAASIVKNVVNACPECMVAHLAYVVYVILPGCMEMFNERDAYVWHCVKSYALR